MQVRSIPIDAYHSCTLPEELLLCTTEYARSRSKTPVSMLHCNLCALRKKMKLRYLSTHWLVVISHPEMPRTATVKSISQARPCTRSSTLKVHPPSNTLFRGTSSTSTLDRKGKARLPRRSLQREYAFILEPPPSAIANSTEGECVLSTRMSTPQPTSTLIADLLQGAQASIDEHEVLSSGFGQGRSIIMPFKLDRASSN